MMGLCVYGSGFRIRAIRSLVMLRANSSQHPRAYALNPAGNKVSKSNRPKLLETRHLEEFEGLRSVLDLCLYRTS